MRLFVMTLALGLAACTLGPEYRRPEPPPVQLSGVPEEGWRTDAADPTWWTRLGDPALEALVQRALAGNRDLRIAVARVQEARALHRGAQLDLLPHVGSVASLTRADAQPVGGDRRVDTQTAASGLDLAWELDLFGRVRRAAAAADAQVQAAAADLRAAQIGVVAEVVRNYFELRGTERRLAVATQNRSNSVQTLQLTELRLREGAGSELDVLSSRARVAAIEAQIPPLDVSAQRTRHRLAVLLGEPPAVLQTVLAPAPQVRIAQPIAIGDPATLLRRRPDVAAAERRLAGATARVGVATAELFPRVSVSGFLGFFSGQGTALLGSDAQAWSIAPAITWPALDLASARARLRAADARSVAALAAYEQTVLLALEEAENALIGYAGARRQLVRLAEQAEAARRAEALAQLRFREGASDFLVLLDAQRTRLEAEDALAGGETRVDTAAVAVYRAFAGWETPPAGGPELARADAGPIGRGEAGRDGSRAALLRR